MGRKYAKLMMKFWNEAADNARQLQQEWEQAEAATASRRATAEMSPSRRSTMEWLALRRTTAESVLSGAPVETAVNGSASNCPSALSTGSTDSSNSCALSHLDSPAPAIVPPSYEILGEQLEEEQHRSKELQADLSYALKKLAFTEQKLQAMYNTADSLREQLKERDREIDKLYKAQKAAATAEACVVAAEAARKRAALENPGSANSSLVRQNSREISQLHSVLAEQRQELQNVAAQLMYVKQQAVDAAAAVAMRDAELAAARKQNSSLMSVLQSHGWSTSSSNIGDSCTGCKTSQCNTKGPLQQANLEQASNSCTDSLYEAVGGSKPAPNNSSIVLTDSGSSIASESAICSGCSVQTPGASIPRRPRYPTDAGSSSTPAECTAKQRPW